MSEDHGFFEALEDSLNEVGVETNIDSNRTNGRFEDSVETPDNDYKQEVWEDEELEDFEEKKSLLEKIKDLVVSVVSFAGSAVRAFLFGDPNPDKDFWRDTKDFIKVKKMEDHIRGQKDTEIEKKEQSREDIETKKDLEVDEPELPEDERDEREPLEDEDPTQVLDSEVFDEIFGNPPEEQSEEREENLDIDPSEPENNAQEQMKMDFICALREVLNNNGYLSEQQSDGELLIGRMSSETNSVGEQHKIHIDDIIQDDKISTTTLASILSQLNNQRSGLENLDLSNLDKSNIESAYEAAQLLFHAMARVDITDLPIQISAPTSNGELTGIVQRNKDRSMLLKIDGREDVVFSPSETMCHEMAQKFADSESREPQKKTFSVHLSEEQDISANISYIRGNPHFTVDIVHKGNIVPLADSKTYLAVEDQGPSQNPKKAGAIEPTLNTFRRDLKNQMSQLGSEQMYSASAIALAVGAMINPAHMTEIKTSGKNQGKVWSMINESHDHIGFVSPDCGRLGVEFVGGYPHITSNIPRENASEKTSFLITESTINETVEALSELSEEISLSKNQNLTREPFIPCADSSIQKSITEFVQKSAPAIEDSFAILCNTVEDIESSVNINPEQEEAALPFGEENQHEEIPLDLNEILKENITGVAVEPEPEEPEL